jgi:hypothetical protein
MLLKYHRYVPVAGVRIAAELRPLIQNCTVRTAVHREWCVLHSRAVCIARYSQLYIWSDSSDVGCITVRVDPPGAYTCTDQGVIPPVQLYGLSDTVCRMVCTRVHVVYTISKSSKK